MDLKLDFVKETKNTFVYKSRGKPAVLNALYIKKAALQKMGINAGDSLIVHIEKE